MGSTIGARGSDGEHRVSKPRIERHRTSKDTHETRNDRAGGRKHGGCAPCSCVHDTYNVHVHHVHVHVHVCHVTHVDGSPIHTVSSTLLARPVPHPLGDPHTP